MDMFGDCHSELRGDVPPKREAMTSGDLLLIAVVFFLLEMVADRVLRIDVRGQTHYYVAGPAL